MEPHLLVKVHSASAPWLNHCRSPCNIRLAAEIDIVIFEWQQEGVGKQRLSNSCLKTGPGKQRLRNSYLTTGAGKAEVEQPYWGGTPIGLPNPLTKLKHFLSSEICPEKHIQETKEPKNQDKAAEGKGWEKTEALNTLNVFLNVGTFPRKTKHCKRLFKGEYVQRCIMARYLSPRYNLKLAVTSTLYTLIRVDTPLNRRSQRFVFCRPPRRNRSENCKSRITKCCACHKNCKDKITKCCTCPKKCKGKITKCCTCHELTGAESRNVAPAMKKLVSNTFSNRI